jgi:uncharacterized membrane protein
MRTIQDQAGRKCLTVFVPSSPTPFTGYVITVPAEDVIDLDVNLDEALRFVISGGVIVPPTQVIPDGRSALASGNPPAGAPGDPPADNQPPPADAPADPAQA